MNHTTNWARTQVLLKVVSNTPKYSETCLKRPYLLPSKEIAMTDLLGNFDLKIDFQKIEMMVALY